MKSILRTCCLFLLLAGFALPSTVSASGSYCVCITKPPTDRAMIDRDKYGQGQKIFTGRTKLMPVVLATKEKEQDHKAVLAELQQMLPKRKAKKTDLTELAGQLSDEQLDALAYYVQLRYGKSK